METKGWIEEFRPKTLGEIFGQEHAKKELSKRLEEKTLRQNILLSGSTGTGKSSIARIIAKTINCQNSSKLLGYDDIQYISPCNKCSICQSVDDEESNNFFHYFDGSEVNKEKILEIKNLCSLNPLFGKSRVIYIDEIQNISSGKDSSLQALLGLLQKDYKGKVYFIMATMELKKVNKAIIDRFKTHIKLQPLKPSELISIAEIIFERKGLLENIDINNISSYDDGIPVLLRDNLTMLAEASEGSARRFIGYLETCVYQELYKKEDIIRNLNIVNQSSLFPILYKIIQKDSSFYSDLKNSDISIDEFFNVSFSLLRDAIVFFETNGVRFQFQRDQFQLLKEYKENFDELVQVFISIYENSSYLTDSYVFSKLYLYVKENYSNIQINQEFINKEKIGEEKISNQMSSLLQVKKRRVPPADLVSDVI